jgi:hypothetical protein
MVESRIDRDEANQAWQFNHQRCKHLELRVFFYRLSQVSFELSAGSKLNLIERFDVQSVLSSTTGYPFERAIREAVSVIATADVCMDAWEPFLRVKRKVVIHLIGPVALVMIVRKLKSRGAERPTPFVRRQRMIGAVDAIAQFHVVEADFEKLVNDISQNFAIGRSQRADRIPHAEELDLCRPGMTILLAPSVGLLALRFPIESFVLVMFVGFSDERQIGTFQNT